MTAKPIFLFSKPRSGTTIFSKLLEGTGTIEYFGEPLNAGENGNFFSWIKEKILAGDAVRIENTHDEFVNFIETILKKSTSQFVLFDIKYEQLHHVSIPWDGIGYPRAVISAAIFLKAYVIQLIRVDAVARIISNELAHHTQVYHVDNNETAISWRDESYKNIGSIAIDPNLFKSLLIRENSDHLWMFRALESCEIKFITVKYEALFDQLASACKKFEWDRVFRHLESKKNFDDISAIKPPLVKVSPQAPMSSVSNSNELMQIISGLTEETYCEELEAGICKQMASIQFARCAQAHELMICDQIQSRRVHEADFNFFKSLVDKDVIFFDIGASTGTSLLSIYFSCPKARIVSFEPNFGNFDLLNRAISFVENEGGNCKAIQCGLSDKKGSSTLYVPMIDDWYVTGEASVDLSHFDDLRVRRRLSSYSNHGIWELASMTIDLKIFDELPTDIREAKEDLVVVKIDVEGHELSILRGMKKFIRDRLPLFLIESDGTETINHFLAAFGYRKYVYLNDELVLWNQQAALNFFYVHDSLIITLTRKNPNDVAN